MARGTYFLSPVFAIKFDDGRLKIDWKPTDYYHFEDLNRVEKYIQDVADLVGFFRSKDIRVNVFTDRTVKSIEFAESLKRIENNIKLLGEELKKPTGYIEPKTDWSYNQPFSYEDANRLERNLKILLDYVQGNVYNIKYSGAYTCGDEGVI